MSDLLTDKLNLDILEKLCSGVGVEVNISALAKFFKRHRNTIKSQVNALFEYNIINRPIYPFTWLCQVYPLLVIARAEYPRNEQIDNWFKEDKHIFAAFYVRDEEYNTLLIEYHENVHEYGRWKKKLLQEKIIPSSEVSSPAHVLIFSNKDIFKYQPFSPIYVMEEKYFDGEELEINGYKMNNLCFEILKKLVLGEGIRTNENVLAQSLNVHRRTIERRISALLAEGIIFRPACRFPIFFAPPDMILVYYLMEIKKEKDKIEKAINLDSHIPLAIEAGIGRYNFLLFGIFFSVEDHFRWEEKYDDRFKDCVGAMKKIYLSPKMAASIDQQKVSLNIIKSKKEALEKSESSIY
jgi:predicted transcriptional regulator